MAYLLIEIALAEASFRMQTQPFANPDKSLNRVRIFRQSQGLSSFENHAHCEVRTPPSLRDISPVRGGSTLTLE